MGTRSVLEKCALGKMCPNCVKRERHKLPSDGGKVSGVGEMAGVEAKFVGVAEVSGGAFARGRTTQDSRAERAPNLNVIVVGRVPGGGAGDFDILSSNCVCCVHCLVLTVWPRRHRICHAGHVHWSAGQYDGRPHDGT